MAHDLTGVFDAIAASRLEIAEKRRLYHHAVDAALQPPRASGWAERPAAPCCGQREECELEAILLAVARVLGKGASASVTEAKEWLRSMQQPKLASRLGRLSKTRNGKAHPDVTLLSDITATIASLTDSGPVVHGVPVGPPLQMQGVVPCGFEAAVAEESETSTAFERTRGDNNRVTMLKPQLGHTEADEASSGLAEEDEPTSLVSDRGCVRQTHHSSSFADDVGGCGFQGGGGGEGVAGMDEPAPPSVHGGGGGGGVVAGASGAASSPQSAADVEAAIARLSFVEIARRFQLLPEVLRGGGADQLSISRSLLALQPL